MIPKAKARGSYTVGAQGREEGLIQLVPERGRRTYRVGTWERNHGECHRKTEARCHPTPKLVWDILLKAKRNRVQGPQ